MYQAIHRSRGIQNNRIIFAYCWIPEINEVKVNDEGQITEFIHISKIRDEFDVREIENNEEEEFFDDLIQQIGDRELVSKVLNEIDYTSKSDTKIAYDLHINRKELWKEPDGRGSPAAKYIKVIRDGIYKRDIHKRKIKKEKYSIKPISK